MGHVIALFLCFYEEVARIGIGPFTQTAPRPEGKRTVVALTKGNACYGRPDVAINFVSLLIAELHHFCEKQLRKARRSSLLQAAVGIAYEIIEAAREVKLRVSRQRHFQLVGAFGSERVEYKGLLPARRHFICAEFRYGGILELDLQMRRIGRALCS